LINNTLEGLLSAINSDSQVIVTGLSSSLIPDLLFENKINNIGGTRIINSYLMLSIVSEADSGYCLFKYCAEKICILNENK